MRNELFSKIPSNLILYHWETLTLLSWKAPIEFKDQENINVSDIKNAILKQAQAVENPLYNRICLRSLERIEELIDILLKINLLIKNNDGFRISNEMITFYRLLKKFKGNLKAWMGWNVNYIYNSGQDSFSTSHFIDTISYTDQDYLDELPHLIVFKEDNWNKLLERCGDAWKLAEIPYFQSGHFLLSDLQNRLKLAISKIAEQKDEFSDNEIIAKIRELETKNTEQILTKMRFECKDGNWIIDEKALKKVRHILETLDWPYFGIIVLKNDYFGLENNNLYIDMPNYSIRYAIEQFNDLTPNRANDYNTLYEEAVRLKNRLNEDLEKEYEKWLRIIIKRRKFGNKPFGIQIKINWEEFASFLEDFSKRNISLNEKYQYLLNSKSPSIHLGKVPETQNQVKEISKKERERISDKLKDFNTAIEGFRDKLVKISRRKTLRETLPTTLLYLHEMESIVQSLTPLVESGAIPSCYRELRKVLENLAWVMFDDILFYKNSKLEREPIRPYQEVTPDWYDWAKREKRTLKNLGDWNRSTKNIVENIYLYGKIKGYNWSKNKIEKILLKEVSYSLFLLLTNVELEYKNSRIDVLETIPENIKDKVHDVKSLIPLANEDLKRTIIKFKNRKLSASDKNLIDVILKNLETKLPKQIVPPYPSNEFVLGFVGETLDQNLIKYYDEMSYFVHSYVSSWQIIPFSSLLEFKILLYELSIFIDIIQITFSKYFEFLFGQKSIKD